MKPLNLIVKETYLSNDEKTKQQLLKKNIIRLFASEYSLALRQDG